MTMAFLTEQDRQKITDAITETERRTSGELVAVIAPTADDYPYVPLLWPAIVALLLPAILLTVAPGMAVWTLYLAQATAFFVLAVLLHLLPVRMALVPQALMPTVSGSAPASRTWRSSTSRASCCPICQAAREGRARGSTA